MDELRIPITETPNPLTERIDIANGEGIVRTLRQSDAQIFSSWRDLPGLLDPPTLESLTDSLIQIRRVLKLNRERPGSGKIIISGCGTSGRFAFVCSRSFNRVLSDIGATPAFDYLVSGGDSFLVMPNEEKGESDEDDPHQGLANLQSIEGSAEQIVFFGVTCGLSAPYVGGQLEHTSQHPERYATILMGFNPLDRARKVGIPLWNNKSFYDLVDSWTPILSQQVAPADRRLIVVNPAVGPEPVTGSTRMKGGSATKIMLDVLFAIALADVYPDRLRLNASLFGDDGLFSSLAYAPPEVSISGVAAVSTAERLEDLRRLAAGISAFQVAANLSYRAPASLGALVELAGHALQHQGGHLFYVGHDDPGLIGIADASEMPDTYGSPLDEVRAFVLDGWKTIANREGGQEQFGTPYRIAAEDFRREILPTLQLNDVVIYVSDQLGVHHQVSEWWNSFVASKVAKTGFISVISRSATHYQSSAYVASVRALEAQYDAVSISVLPSSSLLDYLESSGSSPMAANSGDNALLTSSLKWVLNAVTTGANIRRGMVLQNRMINLGVFNNKLYFRAIDLVALYSQNEDAKKWCEECLLKAIYNVESVPDSLWDEVVQKHVEAASSKKRVVPIAILMATRRFSLTSAKEALETNPIIRNLIESQTK